MQHMSLVDPFLRMQRFGTYTILIKWTSIHGGQLEGRCGGVKATSFGIEIR